jgi:hypothetical protein
MCGAQDCSSHEEILIFRGPPTTMTRGFEASNTLQASKDTF